ncbi:MAG: hypothetical protein KBT20_00095 [Bacteroidales bacterium]|nr:hypothetical protein [Candidatus Liminaster caballi]
MKKYSYLAAISCGVLAMSLASCEDQPNKFELTGGKPSITYIRVQDVAAKDSLITAAGSGAAIAIIGNNLTSIRELYFNDIKAVLNTSYITKNSLLVNVPKSIPGYVTDKIYMVTNGNDTVSYPFHVTVPAADVASMDCEWARYGEEATLLGQFFVNDPGDPLTITFTGIQNSASLQVPAGDIKEITENKVRFIVPDGAPEGIIEVHTVYGDSKSHFYFHDSRGIITDFEGEGGADSKSGIVPQGWNIAATYSNEGGICNNYVELTGHLTDGGGWVESVKLPYWCGNWKGDPMSITSGPGAPLRNIFPEGYFANPSKLSFKFELFIPSSNPWKAGAMQVLFVNNQLCANDSWQNNKYIHTGANGGEDLCRGLYRPWASTGSFDTGDKWITVTIPLSEFTYNQDGTDGKVKLSEESFDSFIMWPDAGGVTGEECDPIFRYDNIRVVPNL